MKIKTLKRSHLKSIIIIGIIVVGIISACILTFTRAKYRTTESIPLVNGTINYSLTDLNLIGVYAENGENYIKVDTIPDSGYTLNEEKSYCKIGNEEQDMTITYDMNTKNLTIAPMTTKGTKCYLYFDEQKILLADAIKRDNTINSGTPDFSKTATTNEGMFKTQDDWGDSYYFRGAVDNNWVKFAGYYWRIVRINGDGSIRLIYNGTSTTITGDSTMIKSEQAFNNDYNRSEYVGYMYTTNEQHGNTTNSDIKTVVDNWYNSNLASYADKISKEAGFCGDREMASGYSWSSQPSNSIYYATRERLISNKTPTLKCSHSSDLYTTSPSNRGNKSLTTPVGLITTDEVSMAGGVVGISNSSYYLYNNVNYWTMSPYQFSSSIAWVFLVHSTGSISSNGYVHGMNGIRPVINLSADITVKSGNGTSLTPYEI